MEPSKIDRKMLTAILARKLWHLVNDFLAENEPTIKLVVGPEIPEGVIRAYLIELLVEAVRLIKEKAKK